jgi:alkylhydroperoxidase family enzyme
MPIEPSGDRNIDKRNAEILGKPPRIPPVDINNLPPVADEAAREIRAAFGMPENGFMPESFCMMLNHPELFRGQMAMGIALAAGSIPPRERELAILRNAWLCGAPYEWAEHVDFGKRGCGLTTEDVERCTLGSHSPDWTEHERAIMKGVEELKDKTMISDETWATLAKTWNDKQLMEFPVLIGAYTATAMQQNSLRFRLDRDAPGLAYR